MTASQMGAVASLTMLQVSGSGPEMMTTVKHSPLLTWQGCSAGAGVRLSQKAQTACLGQGQTGGGLGLGAEQLLHSRGPVVKPHLEQPPLEKRGKPLLPAFFTAVLKEPSLDSDS